MGANNYPHYNYQDYQQCAAPQYTTYQTAPSANALAQNSRHQYQQPTPSPAPQTADYLSSYGAQTYSNQSNNAYSSVQTSSWAGSTYGTHRETTRGAAEVLRNMSNTTYGSNTTPAASQPGYTATNLATARYSNVSPAPAQAQQTRSAHSYTQAQAQAQQTHTTHSYPQAQAQAQPQQAQSRPRSVNANRAQTNSSARGLPSPAMAAGYPAQRSQNIYTQQPQRSPSPAQSQYNRATATHLPNTSNVPAPSSSQYSNYGNRQLPEVSAPPSTTTTTISASHSYAETQSTVPPAQTTPATAAETYNQATATVDPMAVYNPWQKYQRQQEKARQQKAAEDAARAEEERKAEEARQEEERKKEEERKRAEEEERVRQAAQPKPRKQKQQSSAANPNSATSDAQESSGAGSGDLEAEIRTMMAKMRELNSKDPALLARIWEEERRAKAPKWPTTQPKTPAQPAPPQPAQTVAAALSASQGKKAATKEPANRGSSSKTKAPPDATVPAPVSKAQALAPPATPATPATDAAPPKPAGSTVWPAAKKTQLANATVAYLNGQNPGNSLTPENILVMLNGDPSYIELCEALEARSLKLDRALFAKALLTAVPDINSASRAQAQSRTAAQPLHAPLRPPAPPAIITNRINGPVAVPSPQYAPAQPPMDRTSYPPFPKNPSQSPAPVAQMIPLKAELKPPANKEEAARKRSFQDLIDLTTGADEDNDLGPPKKQPNLGTMYSYSPTPVFEDGMEIDERHTPTSNFPVAAPVHAQPTHAPTLETPAAIDLRNRVLVQPLDKKKALRRNGYNIKTIARDVLLACGRHPTERALNAHLEVLKSGPSLTSITNDADLSTLRWDLIDPGEPPKGYYKDAAQTLAEDADDEDDSDEEEHRKLERPPRSRATSQALGGATSASPALAPTNTNPFKLMKRRGRGRPPRHSYPSDDTHPLAQTPVRSASPARHATMSASAPRSTAAAAGVGYSAFRAATEYGPDGKRLPKKKGRPVGWRKAIHGSAAAQARTAANGHTGPYSGTKPNQFTPSQPSSLRNVRTGVEGPIEIASRSPSVAPKAGRYQSFKCQWQNCKADLHNLETLKKHVHKLHCKKTLRGTLECFWGDCGREVTNVDAMSGVRLEKHTPLSFADEATWQQHLELRHFGPLSWELGDGPASGLSDANESDRYLSDAQGRRVTPRISADPSQYAGGSRAGGSTSRGRGRPPKPKNTKEQDALSTQERLVAQKKRMGGPGIDRGGAALVNDKRRRGFSDDDNTEPEFVDAES